MRLIDADKLFGFIQKEKAYMEQNYMVFNNYNKGKYDAYYEMLNIIEEQPIIDAEPVRHGRWILEKEPNGVPYCFHCSICDSDFRYLGIKTVYNYCPNCGAKMDKEVKK